MTEEPHELIVGQSGSGKTTFESQRVGHHASKGAVVYIDPQKSEQALSNRVLPHIMGLGIWDSLVFEPLSDTDRVLAWQILKPSDHPNPIERAKQDEDSIRALANLVGRRSGKPLHTTPMIEEWLIAAITMLFACGAPFSKLPYCFMPDSAEFKWMLEHHRVRTQVEHRNKIKWDQAAMLYRRTPKMFVDQVMHAARRVDAIFTTRFLLRCDGHFDIEGAIAQRKILVFQGDTENEDATRTLLGSVINRVIQNAKDSSSPRCRLIVDECANFGGYVDEYVASALATKRQNNLAITLMTQHLVFPTPDILRAVMTNTQRQFFMRMGDPETARYAAMAVGIPGIDWNMVLRTTERVVRTGDYETELDGRKILRGNYDTERVDHLMSGNDQLLKKQQELMQLQAGWVIEKAFGRVNGPYYVPQRSKRWRLTSRRAIEVMERQERDLASRLLRTLRSGPPYTDAAILMRQWNPPTSLPADIDLAPSDPDELATLMRRRARRG